MESDLNEYSYPNVVERLKNEQNRKNMVDNLLADNLQEIQLSKLSNALNYELEPSFEHEKPETNHSISNKTSGTFSANHKKEDKSSDNQRLQLKILNDKIINLQNLAIIYQDQYVARKNAKQIPNWFTKVVEARFRHHQRRSFEIWIGTLRRQQIVNMMTNSRNYLSKRKV